METYIVSCINKDDRKSGHERIERIGGVKPDGSKWRKSEKEAIDEINSGKSEFYVVVDEAKVLVVVVKDGLKDPYLRTKRDGTTKDNLLELRKCD